MRSTLSTYLIRKRPAILLALGCSIVLAAVLAVVVVRGFRLNVGLYKGSPSQSPDRSAGIQAADNVEKASRPLNRNIETDIRGSDRGAVGAAGLNTNELTRTGQPRSAGDRAVAAGKRRPNTDSDTALFASVAQLERRVAAAIGRARESVVALEYTAVDAPPDTRRGATGVVINNRGEVLSVRIDPPAAAPAPAIGGQKASIVARDFEGRCHSAHWVAADPDTGLTLLRLPPRVVRAIRAATDGPILGSQVFVVGNPFGMGHSVSRGHVAALERALELGSRQLGGLIQIQAPLYPGDSGGAVVNLQGDWLGLIRSGLAKQRSDSASVSGPGETHPRSTSTASPSPSFAATDGALGRPERDTDFGFAIPAHDALWVADQLRAQGRVDRAYLGVRLEPVSATIGDAGSPARELPSQPTSTNVPSETLAATATSNGHETDQALDIADEGAILREVLPGTPASQAGLHPGDGIVALNDHRIRTAHDLTDRLDRIPARTTIQLGVVRGHGPQRQRISVSLRTASRPDNTTRLGGPDSPPTTSPTSSPASVPPALAGVSPGPGVATGGQSTKPELQVQAPAALSTPQPDELRFTLPRAVVDRLEKLERRMEKLEAFPAHPTSTPTPSDREISAARTP
jgi:serine protease Do